MTEAAHDSYWQRTWKQYRQHRLGTVSLVVFIVVSLIGVYAPVLASSKPFVVIYDGTIYFPLFRYLLYTGFFTKRLDIFYNILMFTLPLGLMFRKQRTVVALLVLTHFILFITFGFFIANDPASDPTLNKARQQARREAATRNWDFDLRYMNDYARLNLILREWQRRDQDERLQAQSQGYAAQERQEWLRGELRAEKALLRREGLTDETMPSDTVLEARILKRTSPEVLETRLALPTLWRVTLQNEAEEIERLQKRADNGDQAAVEQLAYVADRRAWIMAEMGKIHFILQPLIRHFHWEDDAGGEQDLNRYVPWWELSRINRKDLVAGLIFGTRISLVVGVLAVLLSLCIGIPIGAIAGYYGGKLDIVVSRLIEIWESMPVFFMLLMVVAITQSKSIFLVISVIGIFGWTGFSRFLRGEFFKQRKLPYVEACHAMGFSDRRTIFLHVLPNAIPPLLTLLPFAIMGAITSEAGLSFIGLGEEGSCSWGVLMDEGRQAFPGESYLLWPPASLLTVLLVSIALIGDALRDAMDPKMRA